MPGAAELGQALLLLAWVCAGSFRTATARAALQRVASAKAKVQNRSDGRA
jgi:hypothetical protein